jgi:type IV fimbrial biogenesis protein FimT
MRTIPYKRLSSGFTVTELVVVLVIVGILTAIGTPTFKYVTASNRISGEVNALLGDMQFARSEAIKNGATVSICTGTSTGTGSTSGTCTQSTSWQGGWIVFLDLNGNGQFGTGDTVLRTQPAFTGSDTFTAPANFYSITYNRMGYAPISSAVTINLHDSSSTSNFTRCLAITPIGGVSTMVYTTTGTLTCT